VPGSSRVEITRDNNNSERLGKQEGGAKRRSLLGEKNRRKIKKRLKGSLSVEVGGK
jgi:hypothetical protein